eukprot:scaffold3340_cov63-Phaeocystis_antarctica.AAC.2
MSGYIASGREHAVFSHPSPVCHWLASASLGGRQLHLLRLDVLACGLLERRGAASPSEPPAEPADEHKGEHGNGGSDPANAGSIAARLRVVVVFWWRQRVLRKGESDGGHLFDRDAQHGGGVGGGAEGGGERGLHRISSRGGGHSDGGGDAHAGGGHKDRDERLVDARGVGNLLLQARLVVVREVADAAAGRQREHDRPHRRRRRRRQRRARRRWARRGRGRRRAGRRRARRGWRRRRAGRRRRGQVTRADLAGAGAWLTWRRRR